MLYEKEDAIIEEIVRNPVYTGKWPQPASKLLDYWGCIQADPNTASEHHLSESIESIDSIESDADVDEMLERIASASPEDRVRDASHIIRIRILSTDSIVEAKSAAEVNSLIMSYALTVHKSQGSEWRRVFVILHQSHNTMIQRELLYTAVTRAREELYVICEPDSFEKGIVGQRIKGNTLQEKAEFFRGKVEAGTDDLITQMNKT